MQSYFTLYYKSMKHLKRKLTIALTALLVILIVAASLIYLSVDFLVNFWWYDELDRSGFFILREFYRGIIGGGFTLMFAALIYTNFRIVSRVSKNSGLAADSDGSPTMAIRFVN